MLGLHRIADISGEVTEFAHLFTKKLFLAFFERYKRLNNRVLIKYLGETCNYIIECLPLVIYTSHFKICLATASQSLCPGQSVYKISGESLSA